MLSIKLLLKRGTPAISMKCFMMRTLFWRLFSRTIAVAHQKSSSFVIRSNFLRSTQRAALGVLPAIPFTF